MAVGTLLLKTTSLRIVLGLIASFLLTPIGDGLGIAPPAYAQDFKASPAEVIRWAKRVAPTNSGLQQRLLELDGKYDVLFIPGIMGSRLKIGDFVWGESKVEADKLVLHPSSPAAEASVLETFEVRDRLTGRKWTKQDIYGKGLDQLSLALEGKEPRHFAYDWRQDLGQVAEAFDLFAQTQLRDKKVVVIAHSMGGLMFWHWKNRDLKPRPFTLLALVVIGSPLEGTCEVARMLIDGYQPYEGASGFEHFAYDLIFRNAHAAMFTFPSVFELLWQGDSCAVLKGDSGQEAQNLLLLDFWKRRFKERFQKFANSTGMPGVTDEERLRNYVDRVNAAIEKAQKFRLSFNRRQGTDSVYYLFSSKHDMPMRFIMTAKKGSLEIIGKELSVKGDGRVPRKSAVNQEFREVPTGHIYQLDAGHGELLSDPKLGDFVEEIKLLIEKDKALEIGAYVASDPDLRKQFSAEGLLISPSPSGVSPASVSDAHRKTVASLNLATVRKADVEVSPETAKQVGRTLEDNQRNVAGARVVYRSTAILNEGEMDSRTLNRLGYILLQEKKFSEAAAIFRKATEKAETTKDPYLSDELKAKIYGNLGTALFHAGFLDEAKRAYEAAKNNPIAQGNLNLLKKEASPK